MYVQFPVYMPKNHNCASKDADWCAEGRSENRLRGQTTGALLTIGMAFARRKPQRDLSITGEFEWVNGGCPAGAEGGGDGGHVRGDSVGGEAVGEDFQVLLEGSLNMSVQVDEGEERSVAMVKVLKSLRSTGSFSKTWKKRWCVLSRTQDGVSIFYYNKQSSYTNCDMPLGVFFLEECRKIFTIPNHPKSRLVFAIDFPYRTVHMYPEKEHELAKWLSLFKSSLGLRDESPLPSHMPLKGLPKQKSWRRDLSVRGRIEEEGVVYTKALVTKKTESGVAREPDAVETPESIKFLSFRTLS